MIQSGTGSFSDFKFSPNGPTVILTETIKFSKAVSNPPVIILNISGIAKAFSQDEYIISYELISSKITTTNFIVNLVVQTIFLPPAFVRPDIKGLLIDFTWMAYDEVTIGA